MSELMKRRLIKGLVIFGAGFLILFIFRFIYGFKQYPNQSQYHPQQQFTGNVFDYRVSNIASSKLAVKGDIPSASYSVDQKYQKIATLNSQTSHFTEDEKTIRSLVKKYDALIQFEQNTGLPKARLLHLAIGVPPAQFDAMIDELKIIGELIGININKTDKTNEFKELKGERSSLEQTRNALIALKANGGKIDEFINLENRILEIEEKLQKLGVQLGDYDATNEFCTVKLTLTERGPALKISLLHRIKVALEWTIKYYLLLILTLLGASLISLLALTIVAKAKNLLGIGDKTSHSS